MIRTLLFTLTLERIIFKTSHVREILADKLSIIWVCFILMKISSIIGSVSVNKNTLALSLSQMKASYI